MFINVFKVFIPSIIAFVIGILSTPLLTNFLYRHKLWKKTAGKLDPSGQDTPIFNSLHKEKEVGTPRMGGIIIWASTAATVLLYWLISILLPTPLTTKLNFLSRDQVLLPFFTLIAASALGLVDDILQVSAIGKYSARGLSFGRRVLVVILIGLAGALWFYTKLDPTINIPFWGLVNIGLWFIPLFILVMLGLFSSGVIDGLDGLAGGIMAIIFAAYAGIAFFQNQINLAAFCATILGGILAFLWFNIPPARFYMSETGILGLTTTLTIIVFLTKSVFWLPIIALPLVLTSLSVIIQLGSKRFRGQKVFLVAPLHHHFEALGWPAHKVVMRYWIIGIVAAIIGMVLSLISK